MKHFLTQVLFIAEVSFVYSALVGSGGKLPFTLRSMGHASPRLITRTKYEITCLNGNQAIGDSVIIPFLVHL